MQAAPRGPMRIGSVVVPATPAVALGSLFCGRRRMPFGKSQGSWVDGYAEVFCPHLPRAINRLLVLAECARQQVGMPVGKVRADMPMPITSATSYRATTAWRSSMLSKSGTSGMAHAW